jgi:hypothetical protein
VIHERLKRFAHGPELTTPDVVRLRTGPKCCEEYRFGEILGVHELVEVVAASEHGDVGSAGIPVDQQIDSRRELPASTGVIDIASFLSALKEIGFTGPVRVEPFNEALRRMPPDQAIPAAKAALDKAFAQAFRRFDAGRIVIAGDIETAKRCREENRREVIGRAAQIDFRLFGAAVENLDGGVVLSIGSAIMGPQVFEKSLSCVNNLRLQNGRPIVQDHSIYVVDLQDGGNWDWSKGEPPKANPAYYLRFCKSFSRMGGRMRYLQCDNATFVHHLCHELNRSRFFPMSSG